MCAADTGKSIKRIAVGKRARTRAAAIGRTTSLTAAKKSIGISVTVIRRYVTNVTMSHISTSVVATGKREHASLELTGRAAPFA